MRGTPAFVLARDETGVFGPHNIISRPRSLRLLTANEVGYEDSVSLLLFVVLSAVFRWIVTALAIGDRQFQRGALVRLLNHGFAGDHRFVEGDLAIVGSIEPGAGERLAIEFGRGRINQVVAHVRHDGTD